MMKRRARRAAAHPNQQQSDFDSYVRNECARLIDAVFRTCGDETLAEDAVQLALLQLCEKWDGVTEPSKWVYKAALCRVKDALRTESRRAKRELRVASTPRYHDPRSQPEEWVCMRMHLDWMLRKLSFAQRAVLSLWSEGLSFADIGEVMGFTVETARSHKCQALKQLREHFATAGVPGEEKKR